MNYAKEVAHIKNTYMPGMRVKLLKMDDVQAPPIGTEGTIQGVDDIGSILMVWDNGSCLSVVLDVDVIEIIAGGYENENMQ